MLAKLTAGNRLTLPEGAMEAVGEVEYFEVAIDDGRIVLTPVRLQQAAAVRSKLESLGITEGDIRDAVSWARRAG